MHPYEPPPLSRLERLVLDSGVDFHELGFDRTCELYRECLRREIAKRRAETQAKSERVELTCQECDGTFDVSDGRARAIAREGALPLCHTCRYPTVADATSKERLWVGKLDHEKREGALAALAALR